MSHRTTKHRRSANDSRYVRLVLLASYLAVRVCALGTLACHGRNAGVARKPQAAAIRESVPDNELIVACSTLDLAAEDMRDCARPVGPGLMARGGSAMRSRAVPGNVWHGAGFGCAAAHFRAVAPFDVRPRQRDRIGASKGPAATVVASCSQP